MISKIKNNIQVVINEINHFTKYEEKSDIKRFYNFKLKKLITIKIKLRKMVDDLNKIEKDLGDYME